MSLLTVLRSRHAAVVVVLSAGGGGTGTQLEGRALDRYASRYTTRVERDYQSRYKDKRRG